MKHIFCNPNLAACNDFLEKEGLVYSQQWVIQSDGNERSSEDNALIHMEEISLVN